MTPNLLARSVETVKGGGLVIVLLPTKQLSCLEMVSYLQLHYLSCILFQIIF